MKKISLFVSLLFITNAVFAQETSLLPKGSWNFGIWTGGGSAVDTPAQNTAFWLAGARFGKVLSGQRGKNALRGQLEYVVEAIPAFLIFQESYRTYGFDITPVMFRWNFTAQQKVIPYVEIGAGILFTSKDFPESTFPVNFTPQGGVGFHIFTRPRQAFTFSFKFMHISNAGLHSPNPGINTLQMMGGYQWQF
jgi:lipid A 3-O-deacylase